LSATQNSWAELPVLLIESEFFRRCKGTIAYASNPVFRFTTAPTAGSDRFVSLPLGVAKVEGRRVFIPVF
jgi:hypothetical protein